MIVYSDLDIVTRQGIDQLRSKYNFQTSDISRILSGVKEPSKARIAVFRTLKEIIRYDRSTSGPRATS